MITNKNKIPKGYQLASTVLEKKIGVLSFGKMINSLRVCDEISQIDLAKKTGISRAFLCDIEKGRRLASPALAAKLAKLMGYSVEHFISVAIQDQLRRDGIHLKVSLKAA
ncbi:MAG: helix-turn-helix transcriptional regulator [Deltaproteobacteria bacterium]|nr:helix-turn-helix transcriptional regulator [Deltaproteobacteria bacterium]